MTKSLSSQFRRLRRDLKKEMDKTAKDVNRHAARNPIRLPVESDFPKSGVTVQSVDNSLHITGDVSHSQIGGTGNVQLNIGESDVVGLLEGIQEHAGGLQESDRVALVQALEELQSQGKVESSESQSFLGKHPLLAMGFDAVITWTATAGLDQLVPIIQRIFV